MNGEKPAPAIHEPKAVHRAWSLYLLTVAGIPIYLHFTFLLLLGFIAMMQIRDKAYFGGLGFVICIFASVVLHELGHALVAKRFGIKTDDIVLYPIGGVARLRSMGEGFQEFWIAIAGPLVNVVIAAALGVGLRLSGRWVPLAVLTQDGQALPSAHFVENVMLVNVVLLVFNLIPAFPMDGGRVLRAILARQMPKARATRIAAKIGQGLAIVFMVVGLFYNPFLVFIGAFVFMAAGQEFAATRSAALMDGKTARDAMITHFDTLAHGDSLGRAAELLLATSQQDFPVLGAGEVLGVLSRKALIQGLASFGSEHYVAEVMERNFPRMRPGDDLRRVYEVIHEVDGLPVLVFDDGERLVGYINHDNLVEYLLIAQSEHKNGHH